MKSPFSVRRRALLLSATLWFLLLASHSRAQTANLPPPPYTFTEVVSRHTVVPGAPGTTFDIGFTTPAISGNVAVFFDNPKSAIFAVNIVTKAVTRLVDKTTLVPGGIGVFDTFVAFQLVDGVVVFYGGDASDGRGLFSVPATGGAITKLIDANTPMPGGGSTTFNFNTEYGPAYRLNAGAVLFAASNGIYLIPATGGAITRVSDSTTQLNNGAYNPSYGDQSGGLAALVAFDSSVYGRSYLYTAPTSGLTLDANGHVNNATFVAGTGSPIPDDTTGDIFQLGVGHVVRSEGDTVVFTGNGGGPNSGIFDTGIRGIYSTANGISHKLVDTSTPVPLGAGTFISPNSGSLLPDANGLSLRDGVVAFLAYDANSTTFLCTVPVGGGAVAKVAASGDADSLGDGGTFSNLQFGANGLSNGRIAFTATTGFEQAGIFVAAPKPSIVPTAGGDTGTVTLTVGGKNFVAGARVTLSAAGKPTLTAELVAPDPTGASLQALFDLIGQADGLYDLTITNADGSVLTYPGSFTVEPGTEPQLYADVIGRAQTRGGYFQTYTILCGNRGNTDAYGVPLVVTVPDYIELEPGNFTLSTLGAAAGAPPPAFTTASAVDPAFVRGNVVLPLVPAGQYVALTVRLKAPSDPQFGDRNFTISALPLRGLLKPNPRGSIRLTGGGGPVLEPQPPVDPPRPPGTPGDPLAPRYPAIPGSFFFPVLDPPILPSLPLPIFLQPPSDYPFPSPADPLPPTGGYESPKIIVPGDPNDKIGSLGAGSAHYLSGGNSAPLRYTVEFENVPTASAAARDVSITDQLDPAKVDLSTFALGPIGFGDRVVTPPPGQHQYTTTVDLRPANNVLVGINAGLNVSTGLLTYTFTSLDPVTGLPPEDPTAGFLPADTVPPNGEGFVFYTVAPRKGLPSGMVITNQAAVVFDVNASILTPVWSNTLDAEPPVSTLAALPAKEKTADIPLQLSGTDIGGSGIGGYNVYVSDDGGPFALGLANVPGPTAIYKGVTGHRYAFFSQAEDGVLNLEPLKNAVEATTTVKGADLIGAWSNVSVKTTASGRLKLKGQFTVTDQSPKNPTKVASVVRFYLSATGVVDENAALLGVDAPFDILEPGASQAVKLTGAKLAVGTTSATGLYAIAVIDPDGAVKETDKSNNTVVFGPLP